MGGRSSLSEEQRVAAVSLLEAGWVRRAVATRLSAGESADGRLYGRWRVRGRGALVAKPMKRSVSFEVVRRFRAGKSKLALAQEFDLSSPKLVKTQAPEVPRRGRGRAAHTRAGSGAG